MNAELFGEESDEPAWEAEAWARIERTAAEILEYGGFCTDASCAGFWWCCNSPYYGPVVYFEPDPKGDIAKHRIAECGYVDTGRFKTARFDGSGASLRRVIKATGPVLHAPA